MGLEFLQKTGRTIKVARDKALATLATADLLTRRMELPSTCELLPGCTVDAGDELHLELRQGKTVAVKGDCLIGEIDDPMPGLVQMLEEYGAVGGRIDEVHERACVGDIEILE